MGEGARGWCSYLGDEPWDPARCSEDLVRGSVVESLAPKSCGAGFQSWSPQKAEPFHGSVGCLEAHKGGGP